MYTSNQTSKQASKQTRKETNTQTSKHTNKQASKQTAIIKNAVQRTQTMFFRWVSLPLPFLTVPPPLRVVRVHAHAYNEQEGRVFDLRLCNLTNQPTKQTNKQTSKQASKQTNKQTWIIKLRGVLKAWVCCRIFAWTRGLAGLVVKTKIKMYTNNQASKQTKTNNNN